MPKWRRRNARGRATCPLARYGGVAPSTGGPRAPRCLHARMCRHVRARTYVSPCSRVAVGSRSLKVDVDRGAFLPALTVPCLSRSPPPPPNRATPWPIMRVRSVRTHGTCLHMQVQVYAFAAAHKTNSWPLNLDTGQTEKRILFSGITVR